MFLHIEIIFDIKWYTENVKDKNYSLEVSIMIDDNNDVKTKSAEAAADAIMESAAKRAEESEAMEKAIDDCLAQMNELKKKVGDYRRKIGRNRKYVLYNAQRQLWRVVFSM